MRLNPTRRAFMV